MTDARIPPAVLEAEDALVAFGILDRGWFEECATIVASEHFYQGQNRRCWALMAAYAAAKPGTWDVLTLVEWAIAKGETREWSIRAFRKPFEGPAVTVQDPRTRREYALAVFDAWRHREALRCAQQFAAEAYVRPGDAQEKIGALIAQLSQLRDQSLSVVIEDNHAALKQLFAHYLDSSRALVVPTGFDAIDEALGGGMVPGSVTVLAGRPGTGKTSLAMQIAGTVAARGQSVTFLSLEMSKERLLRRELCARSGVSEHSFASRRLTGDDWRTMTEQAGLFAKIPLAIQDKSFGDSAGMTPTQIHQCVAETFRLAHATGKPCALIVLDYLQAIAKEPGEKTSSIHESLTHASRRLLAIAKQFHVPILALSAMNREVESAKREPVLRDLRDCGSIESDADQVAFLHPAKDEGSGEGKRIDFIVRKNRHGASDTRCELELLPSTRFRASESSASDTRSSGRVYMNVPSRRAGTD
jgi:replicative DNA helicase